VHAPSVHTQEKVGIACIEEKACLGVETEIKVRINDFPEFRRQIGRLKTNLISPRHFEDNYLFDFEDARLRAGQCLVRVRFSAGKSFLTFKGPPKAEGLFKTREELEIEVGSAPVTSAILEKIGMKVGFRYQKYREEFRILTPGKPDDAVCLSLDETPIGDFAEFEGSEAGIREITEIMGLNESQFMRASYYSLYIQFCRERGEPPGNMIFPDTPGESGLSK
jgi:adenylate cyclase, class 2